MNRNHTAKMRLLKDMAPMVYKRTININSVQTETQMNTLRLQKF